jgi:hypothetical protein
VPDDNLKLALDPKQHKTTLPQTLNLHPDRLNPAHNQPILNHQPTVQPSNSIKIQVAGPQPAVVPVTPHLPAGR